MIDAYLGASEAGTLRGACSGPVLETLIGGLLTGVLYSLVALGFVLIFKASGRVQLRAGRDGAVRRAVVGAAVRVDAVGRSRSRFPS